MLVNISQNSTEKEIDNFDLKLKINKSKADINQDVPSSFLNYLIKNKKLLKVNQNKNIVNNSISNILKIKSITSKYSKSNAQNQQIDDIANDNNHQLFNFNQKNDNQYLDAEITLNNFQIEDKSITKYFNFKDFYKSDSTIEMPFEIKNPDGVEFEQTISLSDLAKILGVKPDNYIQKNTISYEDLPELINSDFLGKENLASSNTLSDWMSDEDIINVVNQIFDKEGHLNLTDLDKKFRNKLDELFGLTFSDDLGIENINLSTPNVEEVFDIESFTNDLAKQIKELSIQENAKQATFIKDVKDIPMPLQSFAEFIESLNKIENELKQNPDKPNLKQNLSKSIIFDDKLDSSNLSKFDKPVIKNNKIIEKNKIEKNNIDLSNKYENKTGFVKESNDFNNQMLNITNNLFDTHKEIYFSDNSINIPNVKISEIKENIKLIFNQLNQNGNYSAEINLTPQELGKMNIIIQIQDESAKLIINAERNTIQSIQSNIDDLIGNLNDKGIKIESYELNINDKSDLSSNSERNFQNNQKKEKENLELKKEFINSFKQDFTANQS